MLFIGIISMILTASMTITIFHKAFDRQIKTDIRQTATFFLTVTAMNPQWKITV